MNTRPASVMRIVKTFIVSVEKQGIPVSQAYLFGSRAKGVARENSDIDICVVSPRLGKNFISEMVTLNQLANTIDDRIESVPLNDHDISDPYSSLVVEIKKYGIPLRPSVTL